MICEFVIVLNPGKTSEEIKPIILEALEQAIENDLDEIENATLDDSVTINFVKQINEDFAALGIDHKAICCFDIDMPVELTNPSAVLENFISNLRDAEDVEHLVKFYDQLLLDANSAFIPKLFSLEMKLRKAISIIYLSSYRDGYYDLLREETTEIAKKNGEKITAEEMRSHSENEFFHLLFSQYVSLNNKKKISKLDSFINLVYERNTFEEFKEELFKKIIPVEAHQDFLASLRDVLGPIEKLRNCIAHNRTPSQSTINNFDASYNKAKIAINEFLEAFRDDGNSQF